MPKSCISETRGSAGAYMPTLAAAAAVRQPKLRDSPPPSRASLRASPVSSACLLVTTDCAHG